MSIDYSLYSGAGNTFALIDNRQETVSSELATEISQSCDVDGAILLEKSATADFKMRTINRDGSEAKMCGNGMRSLIRFLEELEISQKIYHIETGSGTHQGWTHQDEVCVQLPALKTSRWNLSIPLEARSYIGHFLHTGVPHVVIFVNDLDKIDVEGVGKQIRHHSLFGPEGVNVNFATLKPLQVRTYERGVEGETEACGTGAVAAALAAAKLHDLFSPIKIAVRSKQELKISFTPDWSRTILQGPVEKMKSGAFTINKQSDKLSGS